MSNTNYLFQVGDLIKDRWHTDLPSDFIHAGFYIVLRVQRGTEFKVDHLRVYSQESGDAYWSSSRNFVPAGKTNDKE
jgi:hypothetical protein